MRAFPFPDKDHCYKELERDLLYHKIPEQDKDQVVNLAWQAGVDSANELLKKYPEAKIKEIAEKENLKLTYMHKDNVVGKVRYFSEYYSAKKEIIMYVISIEKWAENNKFPYEEALELILSHEIYHHLECTELGLTSLKYTVPRMKIGTFKIGKAGIRAMSEIGAHAFAKTYYESGRIKLTGKPSKQLENHALNAQYLEGKQRAQKIFKDNPIARMFNR